MKRTLIQNAIIVNEGRTVPGSVVIEDEKIAEILVGEEKASAPCDEIIDAEIGLSGRTPVSIEISLITGRRL